MKVLLVCNAGMSSSILVSKMQKAAEARNFNLTITAKSSNEAKLEIGKWDVCLVGPQIRYAVDNIQKILGIPTAAVENRIYAMGDGDRALDQAIAMYEKK